MSSYKESGINVNLAKYPHLRLSDCPKYKDELSEFFFKEVDFIWWNPEERCLFLSDFKDFTSAQTANKIEKVIPNLVQKSIHMLGLLSSIWLKTNGSTEIATFFQRHLPEEVQKKVPVKIVHVINCPPIFDMYFPAINSAFGQRFGAYSILFDIETCIVLPIGRARKELDVFE